MEGKLHIFMRVPEPLATGTGANAKHTHTHTHYWMVLFSYFSLCNYGSNFYGVENYELLNGRHYNAIIHKVEETNKHKS